MVDAGGESSPLQILYEYFSIPVNVISFSCWFAVGFFLTYFVSKEIWKQGAKKNNEDSEKVENGWFINSLSTLGDPVLDEFATKYIENYKSCAVKRDKN